jgi:type IV pilus assembly protein PilM
MVSPFAGITKQLKGLLGGSGSGSVVGIDVGTASIKIVQLRAARGTAVLETYGEIALGPYANVAVGKATRLSVEQTATALQDLLREANANATTAAVSIPFSSSLLSVIEMPRVDESQLKRMIPIEARKYIPVPVSEVALDWFVIPEDSQHDAFDTVNDTKDMQSAARPQEVLLVAIHNETLQRYQSIINTAGMTTKFYEIEIFSGIRAVLPQTAAPIAVVDIGASTTKVYVVERGVVRLSHLFNNGSQHMTETMARSLGWSFEKAERVKRESGLNEAPGYSRQENERIKEALLSTLERVFSEVNRVLLSYGKRYNKNVSQSVFIGGGASLPGLSAAAQSAMNIEVKMAQPFVRTEAPAFLESVLTEIGPGFSVAVGLALRALQNQ